MSLVFFNVQINGQDAGRIVIKLFDEIVPNTCENFKCLCTGELGISKLTGKPLHYKGSTFHRVIKGFMVQAGDIVNGDGTGSDSIYGEKFNDENFVLKHHKPFLVSMANTGPNTNGCQFFITTAKSSHLDGKHIVFGEVVDGKDVVTQIESIRTNQDDTPFVPVVISESGLVNNEKRDRDHSSDEEEDKKAKKKAKKESKTQKKLEKMKKLEEEIAMLKKMAEEVDQQDLVREETKEEIEKEVVAPEEMVETEEVIQILIVPEKRVYKGRGKMRYLTPPPEGTKPQYRRHSPQRRPRSPPREYRRHSSPPRRSRSPPPRRRAPSPLSPRKMLNEVKSGETSKEPVQIVPSPSPPRRRRRGSSDEESPSRLRPNRDSSSPPPMYKKK